MDDIALVPLPGGTVELHDARARHRWEVALEPFEIAVYPVTEEQVAELLGLGAVHPRRPAVDLTWLRAIRVCNAASEWEGLEPAYRFDGEEVRWRTEADGF
ncbi:sulfatase-modifying factor protein, partial [Bacillus toyonensis]|nr:sulfatase-modifying factor protein [Bacillus toyonensis]